MSDTPADDGLDSHALRVVKAIADTGSITAAARALGYSQPAVSSNCAASTVGPGCRSSNVWVAVYASPRRGGCSPATRRP